MHDAVVNMSAPFAFVCIALLGAITGLYAIHRAFNLQDSERRHTRAREEINDRIKLLEVDRSREVATR